MSKLVSLIVALLLLPLLACEKDKEDTAIRVIVDSDLKVGSELTRLEVRIFDPAGKIEQRKQDFAVSETKGAARFTLPMSFRLAPQSQSSTYDFRIVITGIGPLGEGGSDIAVVEQQAIASFRPGETLRLDMFLGRSCLLELCRREGERGELSCDVTTGACAEVPVRLDLPVAIGDGVEGYDDRADARVGAAPVDELDAGQPLDASVDAALQSLPGVAQANTACSSEGAKACGSNNSTSALVCTGEAWLVRAVCDGSMRCDTRDGSTLGTCQPIPSVCMGRVPGQRFCDARMRVTCGVDLLDYANDVCAENQHCALAPTVSCSCDDGYEPDGAGTCRNIDACVGNICINGGKCVDGSVGYTCNCAGTGYEGERCEKLPGACAGPSSCAPEYPCLASADDNYCLGQFARWPMPDAQGGKVSSSYLTSAETVYDVVTGLSWQRTPPATYPNCDASGNEGARCLWANAQSYCGSLVIDGFADWRLPSFIELVALLDHTRPTAPFVSTVFGQSVADSAPFWTSSPGYGNSDGYVFAVNFDNGSVAFGVASTSGARTRCVRGRPLRSSLGPHYTMSPSETSDNWTGLIWKQPAMSVYSWEQAQTVCSGLGGGFRLPTVKELVTLLDPTNPENSPVIGSLAAGATFWTSTRARDAPLDEFSLDFVESTFVHGPLSEQSALYRVACVR